MMKRLRSAARKLIESQGFRVTRTTVPDVIGAVGACLTGAGKPLFLDIGARDGAMAPWGELQAAGLIDLALVEADPQECARLHVRHPAAKVLPCALGDQDSERLLHVTIMPGCSSLLEPDPEILKDYPVRAWFEVVKREPLRVQRYDALVREGQAPVPAFIKIDVQGFEWNVLEGFGEVLDRVLALELEAHFVPLYRGQKTAHELQPYLRDRGFVLRHIERHGLFEEDFVEGNFFYSRRRQQLAASEQAWLSAWEIACGIPAPLPFASRTR